jgi:hypothetical protein
VIRSHGLAVPAFTSRSAFANELGEWSPSGAGTRVPAERGLRGVTERDHGPEVRGRSDIQETPHFGAFMSIHQPDAAT